MVACERKQFVCECGRSFAFALIRGPFGTPGQREEHWGPGAGQPARQVKSARAFRQRCLEPTASSDLSPSASLVWLTVSLSSARQRLLQADVRQQTLSPSMISVLS